MSKPPNPEPYAEVNTQATIALLIDQAADFIERQEWEPARQRLLEATDLGPHFAPIHAVLGNVCFRLGDYLAAANAYGRALDLMPDDAEVLEQAARVQLELNEPAAAVTFLERALKNDPARESTRQLLTICANKQKEARLLAREEARKQFRRVKLDSGLSLEIGDYSYVHGGKIQNPSGARTHISIGKYSSIATDLVIIGYDHRSEWITMYPFLDSWHRGLWSGTEAIPHPAAPEVGANLDRGGIRIGNDVWLGYNVKIFKGVTIGDGAVVGACSLVNKDVPPYTVVAGTPARPIRQRFSEEDSAFLLRTQWWNWPDETVNRFLPQLCSGNIGALREALAEVAAEPVKPALFTD